jgi:hypothetical protein
MNSHAEYLNHRPTKRPASACLRRALFPRVPRYCTGTTVPSPAQSTATLPRFECKTVYPGTRPYLRYTEVPVVFVNGIPPTHI